MSAHQQNASNAQIFQSRVSAGHERDHRPRLTLIQVVRDSLSFNYGTQSL